MELRRLNVIVGPNNSGKSSLIAAFRLVCQTLDSYDDQVALLLNGPFGDFGTFKDIVYKNHRGKPLEISFDVEIPSINPPEPQRSLASFHLVFKYSQEDREIYAQDVEIRLDGDHVISLRYSKEGRRHNVERLGRSEIPSSLKNMISREFRVRHFFPVPMSQRLGAFERDRAGPYREFIEKINSGPDQDVLRKLTRIWSRVTGLISKTDYLGPLRTAPARTYLFTGERSRRIGIGGENLTSLLATRDRKRTRDRDEEGRSLLLQDRLNEWLQKAEMARKASLAPISDRHFEIRIQNFFTKEDQNIADVGFGHSQVLPFLVGGYALGPNSAYFAEQPELHLHPKAQAELGDYLLELYEQRTQVLIETHSEHLILRLQQHIASGSIDCGDVRIFYVCNESSSADGASAADKDEITVLDLDKKGQFKTPWPRGFFPEKLEESRRLAKIRMT